MEYTILDQPNGNASQMIFPRKEYLRDLQPRNYLRSKPPKGLRTVHTEFLLALPDLREELYHSIPR